MGTIANHAHPLSLRSYQVVSKDFVSHTQKFSCAFIISQHIVYSRTITQNSGHILQYMLGEN